MNKQVREIIKALHDLGFKAELVAAGRGEHHRLVSTSPTGDKRMTRIRKGKGPASPSFIAQNIKRLTEGEVLQKVHH